MDRVAEAFGLLLAHIVDIRHIGDILYDLNHVLLPALFELRLQLIRLVKMVLNRAFCTACYDNNILNPAFDRLIYNILESSACRRLGASPSAIAFVAGRNRVPSPAAGMTAFLTFIVYPSIS